MRGIDRLNYCGVKLASSRCERGERNLGVATLQKSFGYFGLLGSQIRARLKAKSERPLTNFEAGQFVCADCRIPTRRNSGKRQAAALFAL